MKARQTELVYSALTRWGYTKFREGKGQEEATMRILADLSTKYSLPRTGTGKSIIYQLPDLMYMKKTTCITLVVSLMKDQVTRLPPFLRAAALHYNSL